MLSNICQDTLVAENNRMMVAVANRVRLSPRSNAMWTAAKVSMTNPKRDEK